MEHLHIVSFNIPYPADYGGVIDIFYKLKALYEVGVKVHLHCYKYGREHSFELNKYCASVHYYNRNLNSRLIFNLKPYIVISRSEKHLLINLLKNDHPILFEGLHTTCLLNSDKLKDRFKMVRTHNIEHKYYYHLFKIESNIYKKIYFLIESIKLRYYEPVLKYADVILPISQMETTYYQRFGKCEYLPAFHSNEGILIRKVIGDGILYHGDLSVRENEKAVLYLIKNVFSKINIPVIIAGKDPSTKIFTKGSKQSKLTIIPNPSEEKMNNLISNAQINVLISFQTSGMKLKLLNALFRGRFCVVNSLIIENTGLENLCEICNDPKQMIQKINNLYNLPFDKERRSERESILDSIFINKNNALKIIKSLPAAI